MVGQTRHWRPLLLGHTGYQPPQHWVVKRVVDALPDPAAPDKLVARTGVRWLLLAPEAAWTDGRRRAAIRSIPGLEPVAEREGWTLLRVERPRPDGVGASRTGAWFPDSLVIAMSPIASGVL